ncbi:efflux RND transporter permease subunit [Myxococcota bacterium]|nr:efflux RND transporter permease subunit [Myxococcota bacterium]MBU1512314.1 efflux RND transporter permease subunit [Myxococcota bacterium]
MNLARFFLSNRHFVWALLIGVAFAGVRAYRAIPMQLFPDTAPPLVNVITSYPGASARDVDENLSQKLETEFASLEGVRKVRSTSQDNLSRISVEFNYDRQSELAALDVQNAIVRIRNRLPAGITEPQVLRFSTADRPVLTLGIVSKDPTRTRKFAADHIVPRLTRVSGVAAVELFGGHVPAVVIRLNREDLRRYGLSFAQVTGLVREGNVSRPAGTLYTERTTGTYRMEMRLGSIDELRDLPIPLPGGANLRLADIATVEQASLRPDALYDVNGKNAIALQIMKTTQGNTVRVVRAVQEELERIRKANPELEFVVGEESASFTEASIGNLFSNILSALLFAGVLIFLFLGRWKIAAVAIVSMPLSYALTFALMKAFAVEFNMVTLTAVILAVGMVVDATVVMLENIIRLRDEQDMEPVQAALEGAASVMLPVLAGAATTLMVLVPMLFLAGFIGKTFSPLALTLVFAFSSSVAVAVVFVPLLTVYTHKTSFLDKPALWIIRPFSWFMEVFRRATLGVLKRAMDWRWITIAMMLILFVFSVRGLRGQGMEMMPRMDGGSFFITLKTPSGTSLEETMRRVREIEELLLREPVVIRVSAQAGFEAGMRTFSSAGIQNATAGFISVTLVDRNHRDETLWDFMGRTRVALSRVPGVAEFSVREQGNTAKSTTAAPIVIRLSGEDARVLQQLGEEVRVRLARVPNLVEPRLAWKLDEEQSRLSMDRLRSATLGLGIEPAANQLAASVTGLNAGEFFQPAGTPEPIRVELDASREPTELDYLDTPLAVPGVPGGIPARTLVRLDHTLDRGLYTREDFLPVLEVTASHQGRPLSQVVADVTAVLKDLRLPAGYEMSLGGENSDMKEASGELVDALLLALAGVYLLLVAQLRSWLYPLIIMFSIPLSLIGVFLALRIGHMPISMPVMIGLILLVGTVVNNAIILQDFYHTRKQEGIPRREALLEAVSTRFRPIMMTSISTIVGMIPLAAEWALGAERFSPLATALIGGMTASTVLTLVFIPVLTDWVDSMRERFAKQKA